VKFNISKEELNALYSKAEAGYYKCINKKGNKFLEEEMQMPFSSVRVERSEVKVIFFRKKQIAINWKQD
jgi:arsenate reductase-like glutaredoxin family protein